MTWNRWIAKQTSGRGQEQGTDGWLSIHHEGAGHKDCSCFSVQELGISKQFQKTVLSRRNHPAILGTAKKLLIPINSQKQSLMPYSLPDYVFKYGSCKP